VSKRNQLAKEIDYPSQAFQRKQHDNISFSQFVEPPHSSELLDDSPPSRNDSPYLKIIMPPASATTSTPSRARTFRPDMSNKLPGSTISSSEREIFAKIFDQMLTLPSDLSKPHSSIKPIKKASKFRETVGGRGKMNISATLLDEDLYLTPQEAAEYPPGLRPLAARLVREDESAKIGHWTEVQKEMDQCNTEVDLLKVLDKRVFSVMQGDDLDQRAAFREAYPLMLLKAMRMFRVTFHKPLLAMTLFFRVKGLSAESYVLGCTTQLYNELLLARWDGYADLSSVIDTLDEMSANGLRGDRQTVQILQRVRDDVDEWITTGNEVIQVVWREEKDRMNKVDKIQREMIAKLESEVQKGEDLEKEVGLIDTDLREYIDPAERLE
jgi:hypothetical protein